MVLAVGSVATPGQLQYLEPICQYLAQHLREPSNRAASTYTRAASTSPNSCESLAHQLRKPNNPTADASRFWDD